MRTDVLSIYISFRAKARRKKITLPEDLVACSKEKQEQRGEVADSSQECWAKDGPRTGTRGLTSALTD